MRDQDGDEEDTMKTCKGLRNACHVVFHRLSRRHPTWRQCSGPDEGVEGDGGLKRCLSVGDLVSLGVGSCCGTGIYLTAGLVASQAGAGGAAVAFLLGGLASLMSGLCYAELAALCPRTSGSAYMYSYVTVGEFVAYVIGWGLMLEYVIGTAAGAVSLSAAINSMVSNSLGWPYPQLLAGAVCLLLTVVLAMGVELSARVNHFLNAVTGAVWLAFLVAAACLARPALLSTSGAFPSGFKGALHAVPVAYYAFVGFDTVACTGEESRDPRRDIPRAILLSVLICMAVFSSVAILLTLLLPISELHPSTAMLDVLQQRGLPLMKPMLFVGATSGLLAATFGSLFPMPRVLYAMAKDRLTLGCFTYVNPKRKTAEVATAVSGLAAALLATLVDLQILIELVLMGTLLSYILVAFCVLVMRYTSQHRRESCSDQTDLLGVSYQKLAVEEEEESIHCAAAVSSEAIPLLEEPTDSQPTAVSEVLSPPLMKPLSRQNSSSSDSSTPVSKSPFINFWLTLQSWLSRRYKFPRGFVTALIVVTFAVEVLLSVVVVFWGREMLQRQWLPLAVLAILASLWLVAVSLLACCQQARPASDEFRCPWVPLLPCLVSFFNIYLMASLKPLSWQLFTLWILLGLVSYCVCAARQKWDGH